MWNFRMGEPFFMILSSIQMGSGSFSASAWKVCFREASAKNMNTFTKSIPKSLPPCVYHSSCKTYCKYMQIRYLYMMFVWNVKDKVTKSCKTHFRETSTQKTWKLLPRASATAVRCRFLIHMSKSCTAKMTTLKTETHLVSGFITATATTSVVCFIGMISTIKTRVHHAVPHIKYISKISSSDSR